MHKVCANQRNWHTFATLQGNQSMLEHALLYFAPAIQDCAAQVAYRAPVEIAPGRWASKMVASSSSLCSAGTQTCTPQ